MLVLYRDPIGLESTVGMSHNWSSKAKMQESRLRRPGSLAARVISQLIENPTGFIGCERIPIQGNQCICLALDKPFANQN